MKALARSIMAVLSNSISIFSDRVDLVFMLNTEVIRRQSQGSQNLSTSSISIESRLPNPQPSAGILNLLRLAHVTLG